MAAHEPDDFDATDHNDIAQSSDDGGVKKRKRDTTQTSEIEVDVAKPEPPSKKALRKAKRQKPSEDAQQHSASAEVAGISDTSPGQHPNETSSAVSKPAPSPYSVWIGNLPFTVTKGVLRTFLTSNSTAGNPQISGEVITRIYIPAPPNAPKAPGSLKPQNKGFAYVDLSTESAFNSALALSETPLGGRRLLIKSAKDFAGRPDKTAFGSQANGVEGKAKSKARPMKRIFVGNLAFDVSKDDLFRHFSRCGFVEDVFIATFEDTGRCKGFAYVTFDNVDAASDAVRGWTYARQDGDEEEDEEEENAGTSEESEADSKPVAAADKNKKKPEDSIGRTEKSRLSKNQKIKKKAKPRKWFVNQLHGRALRCEFAEDPETRYKKRFNSSNLTSETRNSNRHDNDATKAPRGGAEAAEGRRRNFRSPSRQARRKQNNSNGFDGIHPGAPTDAGKRRGRSGKSQDGINAIVNDPSRMNEASGTKITFD